MRNTPQSARSNAAAMHDVCGRLSCAAGNPRTGRQKTAGVCLATSPLSGSRLTRHQQLCLPAMAKAACPLIANPLTHDCYQQCKCCSKYRTQLCKCSENSSSTDCRFDRRLARSGRQSPDARSHKLLPADQHNLRQPDCTKASERPLTLAAAAQTAPSQQCCCS